LTKGTIAVLAETFADLIARHADRTALSDPDRTLTFRELGRHADDIAALLDRRVVTDGPLRAGILASNSVAYVTSYLGMLRAGAVPFLIDAALGPGEVARIVDQCSLDLLVHDERDLGELAATPYGDALGLRVTSLPATGRRHALRADTEVCRFTSGSTGVANCIEFSGRTVAAAAANWAAGSGLRADDRIACFAALSNGLAFNTSLLAALGVGAGLHLTRGLPTGGHITRMLDRTEATWLVGFPALYESVVRRGLATEVFGRVRIAISSGAPLRVETRRAFAELTGLAISNYYGVAETGPLTFTATPEPDGGLGSPLPGAHLRAGDPGASGEILVRSESMGSGYLNVPGVFEARIDEDGFYHTGDEGYLLANELFLTGRTSRMINFGGRKVDPLEVGDLLRRLAGVRDAIVFEVMDKHGEPAVAAAVVTDPGLDAAALRAHCAAGLAAYKVPSFIELVPEFPANSIGKPSMAKLRELVADSQG
jgi:acyl-CoA synthetase (AMP-forming)/AMP-acid ligase II